VTTEAVTEIKFRRDTSFRKQFFVPDSFSHPAKMDAQLLLWITEHYTQPGETILDPMAGSGTTMLACTLGRDVVLVELEDKFCKMCEANWREVRMRPQLGSTMGDCTIIRADARRLPLLSADKIVSSPPYGNRLSDAEVDDGDPQRMSYRQALGKADKIVTSPPYSESNITGRPNSYQGSHGPHSQVQLSDYRVSNDNIGNLPYGDIDKIVTSPPFAQTDPTGGNFEYRRNGRDDRGKSLTEGVYAPSAENLGNLPYGDISKIITSPPYANRLANEDRELHGGILQREMEAGNVKFVEQYQYSKDPENIGNLKSDSYLEAMLQVYRECYRVLRAGGLMVLVTKNFIRNKQVVRLDTDTIKLCEQAGFKYMERHYRRLPSQSFWRTIYHQKHPEVEQIEHEDVLVLEKI